jgi:chromosome partitioning protein
LTAWPKLSETLGGTKAPDRCQSCGAMWADLERWREHDESDLPTNIVVVLCIPCGERLIGPHPRLYSRLDFEHHPGSMEICILCRHREGVSCPMARFNGGPGVGIAPAPSKFHVRSSVKALSGVRLSWREAESCTGREVLALVGMEGGGRANRLFTVNNVPTAARPVRPEMGLFTVNNRPIGWASSGANLGGTGMKVITLLNMKGGVGKTSCTHHLSGTLAQMGLKVLLVDNDPQSSLSQGFWGSNAALGIDPSETVAAIHRGDRPFPDQVIKPTGVPGVDIVPGSIEATRSNVPEPERLDEDLQLGLASFLGEVAGYDLALIDCPPNLHLCSWAALAASHHLVVPTQPEDYGSQGLRFVRNSADMARAALNPGLGLLGYLLTRVGRKAVHQAYEATLRAQYGAAVFDAKVPDAVGYVEAIAARKPVAFHRPRGGPAKAIRAVADELLSRIEGAGSTAPQPAEPHRAEVA